MKHASLPCLLLMAMLAAASVVSALGAPELGAPLPGAPVLVAPLSGAPVLVAPVPGLPKVALQDLDLGAMTQEWGTPQAGRSVDGNPLTMRGEVYASGVGTHAASEITIALDRMATLFTAWVGVDDEVGRRGSVRFVVRVDGREAVRTEVLHGGDAPRRLSVDLCGAQLLVLAVENAGDDINYDHADWADARLEVLPDVPAVEQDAARDGVGAGAQGGALAPSKRVRSVMPPPDVPLDIVRPESPLAAIHGPRVVGATPGRPFLYRIPATGAGPLRFAARGLPGGLSLERWTGLITGSLASAGSWDVTLTVTGAHGSSERGLQIVGGEHELALTPPLGWNSWNVWGTAIDDAKVRAAADAMVSSGLAAHGFRFVNIDDGWEAGRDAQGRILSNEKFPDMSALSAAVHERGLLLGIYSSPGPKTCAGYEGSFGHEAQDAQTWADWGIDYLKYDWCSYGGIAASDSRAEHRKPYEVMRAALDGASRDIVYSLCQYGMSDVWTWGAEVGGNLWRTTGDITDNWSSMSGIGFQQDELSPWAGPGHWNDPDMLVVGQVGWGPELRASRLTPNEQITHITLWSMLAAPLLIGCDMTQLDAFTRALLTNDDVLDVDQDPLGHAARRIGSVSRATARDGTAAASSTASSTEVWARPLFDGSLAVALFNRGPVPAPVTATWEALGLKGSQPVRNCWLRRDEGEHDGSFTAEVPRHGAQLFIVGRKPAGP